MRGRLIHWPGVLRFLAFVAIAIALIAAATLLRHHGQPPLASAKLTAPSPTISPLIRELARCQNLGDRAADDPECLAAWSENRRRFFDAADISQGASETAPGSKTRSASHP